jgi:hypothetical protein
MARASVAAAGFAVAGGSAAETAGAVLIAPVPDRDGRVLLACVEPLDLSARGRELAGVALRAIRKTFAATPGLPADALHAAFAAANRAVAAENRPQATGRWERRICVGATAIVLAGREITLVQTAPSQVLLVQDNQVYAFPDVASWRGDFLADDSAAEAHPLGYGEDANPRLYVSEAAPGDLIALCSTSVGRVFADDETATIDLFGGAILTRDLEGSVDRLERLLARQAIGDAFAVVAAITRLPRRPRLQPAMSRQPARTAPDVVAGTNQSPVTSVEPAAHWADAAPSPRFQGLRDWLVDLAELVSAARHRPEPVYRSRQRALAAPGALSVQRYRESTGLPAEWRANLPRGPGMHVPARLLAVSLVLFVALGGTGLAVGRQRDREARATSSLVLAETALADAQTNPGTAMSSVAAAEAALTAARDAGASDDALTRYERELARVRDDVWNIRRLADVARIGALPDDAGRGPVHLALGGHTLYIAAGNLYELDADGGRLVTLLTRGEIVDGEPVGDIRHVSVDGGEVVASNGSSIYRREASGRWQRAPLAIPDIGSLRPDGPVIAWGDAVYALSWDGDIVRFEGAESGSSASIWANAGDSPDLELARDLAIDGQVHVLLEDGRVLTFARRALVGTTAPFVVPVLDGPAFFADAPFASSLYIVDRNGKIGMNAGRIVQVDVNGNARQYLAPVPAAGDASATAAAVALAAADDLTIDELTGDVYWVAAGEIWRAGMPLS